MCREVSVYVLLCGLGFCHGLMEWNSSPSHHAFPDTAKFVMSSGYGIQSPKELKSCMQQWGKVIRD